ncbi:MAG TPA: DUF3298 domain-containing protein [Anaerolineales bacterium]|nr:DUF3298 domain-containing protein [Anaerolineales bacterium]
MNRNPTVFLAVILMIALSGCSTLGVPATPTPAPTQTSAPTATPVPFYQQITVATTNFSDSGKSPDYAITAQIATINGSDPRAVAFTAEMNRFVQGLIADFKKNMASLGPPPIQATSSFDVRYQVISPPGNILSIKYQTEGYVAGMAHPYHSNYTFNYDLEAGKDIALNNLFLPNTDYLGALSKYCAAQLGTRDIDFKDFSQGADPTADNYKNWNIAPDGLMITFDEYQVAAYVAGPQVVTVPYSELKNLIDPKGPLASFIK